MAEITTDQLPDYNNWSKEDWITFHRLLKQKFGRTSANKVWSKFFNNKPIGWTRDEVYTSDPDFKAYFKSQGIKFDPNFYSQLDSIGSQFTSFVSALPTAAKIGGGVVIAIGVFALGYGIIKIAREGMAMQRSAQRGAKKILENPEVVAKALI